MKTLTTFLFIISISAISTQIKAQAPEIEWQNTIGGNHNDYLYSIQQTTDGGYILGGYSGSGISGDKTEAHLSYDYWVVKINSIGDIEWQSTIGGNSIDFLNSLQQTADGGYILGGYSGSGISGDKTEASLSYDYWVVKINSIGDIEWQNTIGGSSEDYLYSVQQTTDGGYILGGVSSSGISGDKTEANIGLYDYWVIKLNNSGTIEWQRTFGGNNTEGFWAMQQTMEGGYILGGHSNSGISGDKTEAKIGSYDYWVLKLNSAGEIEWQNTIGGDDDDRLNSVQQTNDGGYILGGFSYSGISGDKTEANLGSFDLWVVKLNTSGGIEWQNTIGGYSDDRLNSVQQTNDGGYILGGFSYSGISGDKTEDNFGDSWDYWVVKLYPDDCILDNFYADADGDGFGDNSEMVSACSEPSGYVSNHNDCNDANASIYPFATEICDAIDDDCDGDIDDELIFEIYYLDADEDTYGDVGFITTACSEPTGYVVNNSDCNDANNLINPGATEICNAVDDNCDGNTDEDLIFTTYYLDADADGFGDVLISTSTCDGSPASYVEDNSDCNDGNNLINPAVTEICNSLDDNCDGNADEGLTFTTYYLDADADGFGNTTDSISSCSEIGGYVANNFDCNDVNNLINPSAIEICNAIDDNCDGNINEGLTFTTYYLDADADGFGDVLVSTSTCDGPPTSYVEDSSDCNDANDSINIGTKEICNAIDDNCDGNTDEGFTFTTYYFDADTDEFGDVLVFTSTCDGSPTGYVNDSTDCDDTNPNIYPGATEILNGIDDNCNNEIDEGIVNINSIENNFFINIFPNPANDKIIIAFNEQINTEAQITITDLTGKLISTFVMQSSEQEIEIDISSYAASLYFVKLQYDGITELEEFIKE